MTQRDISSADGFGWWYRFRCLVVFNLLYVAGPAQLDGRADPRRALEEEYERRQALHRQRLGKPPLVRKEGSAEGPDPVVLLAVGGVLAVVLLLVWAVVSAR